jgi:hypothetical protein
LDFVRHIKNISGSVVYSNGQGLPSRVGIHFVRTDTLEEKTYYVDVRKGSFSIYLPTGTYRIKDVATGEGSTYFENLITVDNTFTIDKANPTPRLNIIIPPVPLP